MLAARPSEDKPYFLQGLLYAKSVLQELRKGKQEELHLSPIRRKHTKFSNDTILEDQQEPYYNSPKRQQNGIKVNHQRSQSSNIAGNLNFSKNEHYRNTFERENTAVDEIAREIEEYRQKINEIAIELEQTDNQVQSYEIVLENLGECYRANSAIVNKNHKLKRQSLRLAEERTDIKAKLKNLEQDTEEVDLETKNANSLIQKYVQEYVRSVLVYNREEQIETATRLQYLQASLEKDSEQDESYTRQLNLNFKQLKKSKEEFTQKKVLLQPKKLQKGVSFEEEIDVISKYYEAQLSNI